MMWPKTLFSLFLFSLFSFLPIMVWAVKLPSSAPAASSGSELSELNLGIERSLYMDIFLFTGYVEFSHPNMNEAVTGAYTGVGGTIGVKLWGGLFGGTTVDYRYMGQTTTVDNNHLNLSSTRFVPFAPTLGYKYDRYLVKLDYQFAGSLDIKKSLTDGSELKFNHPEGIRLMFIFDKWFGIAPVGLYYESVRFKEQSLSQTGVSQLGRTFDTWQFGGLINVLF